ncbi:hypothetical protein YPPY66_4487 [Yersinia pestis PY-66]|uniref:Uncharacterized protein n=2 Tax=Yersinia pestis TaxID=632 RepID=A0AAV3BF14_YERPE|nr:hypothetical protein YPC_4355 [Yersinia pestis biovar Medievalis str. Harbin 35]EDR33271.1 hypothetical protein YPIP275_0229 [Yersinia pestis biovar Orientalis str. IP275]EDR37724.1 hypothetical protein YpF1991016_2398 [Yersinia pestis biovar Orientalis str. F1991016]EDR41980.1 hypothetical protein YpE1979001_4497 [Yersinia pestis biovar Antiqua str. E1979001]EDR49163.1 hypothetical protein YpB42003004_0569 [Yersinia pestis biovar Antiqua str. B42003004]EDR57291.1 hypothetical protein YpMG0
MRHNSPFNASHLSSSTILHHQQYFCIDNISVLTAFQYQQH